MKKHVYIYVLLIFLILLNIAAISAADDSATDISYTGTNEAFILEETLNEEIITISNDDDINLEETFDEEVSTISNDDETVLENIDGNSALKDSPQSFTQLNNVINGNNYAEINLESDYKYTNGDDSFIGGINISRAVTINGNNHTIDGANNAHIFNVKSDRVTIKNINFINGKADSAEIGVNTDGGAIHWEGSYGKLLNSTFTNNFAANTGGAIHWAGEYGTISDSTFTQNSAELTGGGAIWWNGRFGSLSNSTFTLNNAKSGGAIYWFGNGGNLTNSTFTQNTAKSGGAISFFGDECTISKSIFIKNNANTYNGGAIHFSSMYGNIMQSIFINNTANYGAGAIDWGGMNGKINNNIFLNNGDTLQIDEPHVYNLSYNWFGNNATNYNEKPIIDGDAELSDWLFLNATANQSTTLVLSTVELLFKLELFNNGEISQYDYSLLPKTSFRLISTNGNVENNMVLGERIQYDTTTVGAGTVTAILENVKNSIEIKITDGTTFWDLNQTINFNDENEITLNKTYTFDSYYDEELIQGIIINRTKTIDGNDYTIDGANCARIFKIIGENVTIKNINFMNGNASGANFYENAGGAIQWTGRYGNLSDSRFTQNNAEYGSSIYWAGENGTVRNSTFTQNNASQGGGAIYWAGENGTVRNSTFKENTANGDGGAIYWKGDKGNIIDLIFTENTANGDGGAIYLRGNNDTIKNSTFTQNTANNWGGAIYLIGDNDTVTNSRFAQNNASSRGGAILWFGDDGNLTNSIFTQNTATDWGGAIYWISNVEGTNNNKINDNIFLNNEKTLHLDKPYAYNVSYNWFGNNETDYNEHPKIYSSIELSDWLFLNATANPSTATLISTSDILFKLYLFNGKDISDYDNNLLPSINLTLSSNGNIDKYSTGLNEIIKYNATEIGTGSVTASIENIVQTIELDVILADPKLSVRSPTITYGENTIIILNYNSSATGKVNITLISEKTVITFPNQDLNTTIILPNFFLAGNYNLTVSYSGDENFLNATAKSTLIINNANSTVKADNITITYGETIAIQVISENASSINYEIYDAEDIKVQNGTIKANGTITGFDLPAGEYTVNLITRVFDSYNSVSNTSKLTINKASSSLSADDVEAIFGYDITIPVISENATEINYLIKDQRGNTVANGTIQANENISLGNLDSGEYTAEISFAGNENYTGSNTTAKVTIQKDTPELTAQDITTRYNINKDLTINLKDSQGNPLTGFLISIDLNNTKNYTTDSNGQIKIATKGLNTGTYTAKIEYKGNQNYEETNTTAKVTIQKDTPELTAQDITTRYNINKDLTINLKDSQGNPLTGFLISIDLNNTKNYTTDSNGQIKIATKGLNTGTYTAKIEYKGNQNYEETNTTAKVTIQKDSTKIAASAVSTTYNVKKNLVIALKDSQGNGLGGISLTVKITNNKKYTTDKNGQVKINLAKLVPKTYTAKISFTGNANYKASSATSKITVKKAKVKIAAKKKRFKVKTKVKKYTVRLKNNLGKALKSKKLTLKVKGKTYKAKTNKKGKATFRIKNLKRKGKYKGIIKFAGNKYYKKATKKVRLTVKKSKSWKTIAKGSKKKSAVKKIQRALKKNGYYLNKNGQTLKIDGIYGTNTVKAVKQFQKAKKLKASGKVDKKTAAKLKIIS